MGRKLKAAIAVLDSTAVGLRAVDYLRVSTEDQKKGYGVAYTGKKTRQYIDRKGWIHIDTYADEGYSGSLPVAERPDLRRLMDSARKTPRPFDVVVVAEERAIGRAGRAFWPWVWELYDLGVFVAIVRGDYDNTTDDGWSRMRKAADRAEDERIIIRDRTQGGIQEKAEQGGYPGGRPPFGWRIEGKGQKGISHLVVDDAPGGEAEVARHARRVFIATRSWDKVASALNSNGFRTRSGKPWTGDNIRGRMLSDTLTSAIMPWRSREPILDARGEPVHGESVKIQLPPIFSEKEVSEFRTALDLSRKGRAPRRNERVYPLSGHIASPCGGAYVGASNHGPTYRCNRRSAEDCSCSILQAQVTEHVAWNILRTSLLDPDRIERMVKDRLAKHASEAGSAAEQVRKLERQVADQLDVVQFTTTSAARQAVARGLSGETAQEFIDKTVGPLNAELSELEKALGVARAWLTEASSMTAQIDQVRHLSRVARDHLGNASPSQQADVYDLLGAEVKVTSFPPRRSPGAPHGVRLWFQNRGRGVPVVTDELWSRIRNEVGGAFLRPGARSGLEALLAKATQQSQGRSPAESARFHRWRQSGAWDRAMRVLEGAETVPLGPDASAPELAVSILPMGIDFDGSRRPNRTARSPESSIRITLTLTA